MPGAYLLRVGNPADGEGRKGLADRSLHPEILLLILMTVPFLPSPDHRLPGIVIHYNHWMGTRALGTGDLIFSFLEISRDTSGGVYLLESWHLTDGRTVIINYSIT